MLDVILRLAGLAGFIASLAVLVYYVPEKDLAVVLILVAAMAIYDLMIRPVLTRTNNHRRD